MGRAHYARRERKSRPHAGSAHALASRPRRPTGAASSPSSGLPARLARLGGAAACLLAVAFLLLAPAPAGAQTVPTLQSATVNGTTLTLNFTGFGTGGLHSSLYTSAAPDTSRFTVAGTSSATTVTHVGFTPDGRSVRLGLSPAVTHGDTGITVSYAKGNDANPLRGTAGSGTFTARNVADFSNHQVTNSTPAVPDPNSETASVRGSTLTLTFPYALYTGAGPPSSTPFTVAGTASATSVTGVAFSGDARSVLLTLSPAVTHGDTGITVSYIRGHESKPLTKSDGGLYIWDFFNLAVTNLTDAEPGAPTVTAESSSSLRVAWRAPLGAGGTAITDYDVRWRERFAIPGTAWTYLDDTTTSTATHTKITGLEAGTTYEVQVRAEYDSATSIWSESGFAATHEGPLPPPPTATPGAVKLVSNLSQSGTTEKLVDKNWRIGFRTGGHADGYKLTGVVVDFPDSTDSTLGMRVHVSDSAGVELPGGRASLNILTLALGNYRFTVPDGGVDLEPNSDYFLWLFVAADGNLRGNVALTKSGTEDSVEVDGWSIANRGASQDRGSSASGDWTSTSSLLKFTIEGYEKKEVGVASARASGLVSNLGQFSTTALLRDSDRRTAFRTGSHADGYKLTGVVLDLPGAATSTIGFSVTVLDSNRNALPRGALTAPSTLSNGNNRFRAPGDGVDLDANSTYYLFLDVTGQGNSQGQLTVTQSANDDPGAAAGWSIADDSEYRDWDGTAWLSSVAHLKFAIEGYGKNVTRPTIEAVSVVSSPTHDSDGDGINDTYVRGDKILIDVAISGEAVKVTGIGLNRNVDLRLAVGTGRPLAVLERVLLGGKILRFAYTVEGGNGEPCNVATTTADCDTDGIAPAPATINGVNYVLVAPTGFPAPSIAGADTGVAADLRYRGGFFNGVPERLKVDGSVAKADSTAGPRVTAAEVPADSGGKTIKVTFDRELAAIDGFASMDLQQSFTIQATNIHRKITQSQHPTHVSRLTMGGIVFLNDLVLTLGEPVRAGDRVALGYGSVVKWDTQNEIIRVLKGTDGKPTPVFGGLHVVNNLPGAPPIPTRAYITGTSLRIVFDKALNESAAPAGSAFRVDAGAYDGRGRRTIQGTGTAAVSGSEIRVTLASAVHPGETASVDYTKPSSNPLKGAGTGGGLVNAIDDLAVWVHDVTVPEVVPHDEGLEIDGVVNTVSNEGSGKSAIAFYFDERLDPTSVPAKAAFKLSGDTGQHARTMVDVDTIDVVNNALVMTTNKQFRLGGRDYTIVYTPPSADPLQDLTGNGVVAATWTARGLDVGQPMPRGVTVNGDVARISMENSLNPAFVPAPSAFTLWETNKVTVDGTTTRPKLTGTSVASVTVESTFVVLRLNHPIMPCNGTHPFRVSYDVPSANWLRTLGGWSADSWAPEIGGGNNYARATNALASKCVRIQ